METAGTCVRSSPMKLGVNQEHCAANRVEADDGAMSPQVLQIEVAGVALVALYSQLPRVFRAHCLPGDREVIRADVVEGRVVPCVAQESAAVSVRRADIVKRPLRLCDPPTQFFTLGAPGVKVVAAAARLHDAVRRDDLLSRTQEGLYDVRWIAHEV